MPGPTRVFYQCYASLFQSLVLMRCMSCVWITSCEVNQFVGKPSFFVSKQSIKIIIKTTIAGKWADNPKGNIKKKCAFTMLFAVALWAADRICFFMEWCLRHAPCLQVWPYATFSQTFFSVYIFNGKRLWFEKQWFYLLHHFFLFMIGKWIDD